MKFTKEDTCILKKKTTEEMLRDTEGETQISVGRLFEKSLGL